MKFTKKLKNYIKIINNEEIIELKLSDIISSGCESFHKNIVFMNGNRYKESADTLLKDKEHLFIVNGNEYYPLPIVIEILDYYNIFSIYSSSVLVVCSQEFFLAKYSKTIPITPSSYHNIVDILE